MRDRAVSHHTEDGERHYVRYDRDPASVSELSDQRDDDQEASH